MTQAEIIAKLKSLKAEVEKRLGCMIEINHLMDALDCSEVIEIAAKRAQESDDGKKRRTYRGYCVNIDGWTAREGGDGYYRMYKTIEGKTESLYLGKALNRDKARRKIAKKEKQLGLLY